MVVERDVRRDVVVARRGLQSEIGAQLIGPHVRQGGIDGEDSVHGAHGGTDVLQMTVTIDEVRGGEVGIKRRALTPEGGPHVDRVEDVERHV